MPVFEGKGGKKSYHMNPQMGKALHKKEEPVHQEVKKEEDSHYDGHEHNGEQLAHHVEVHHGGHPDGEPPMTEAHTHHVIIHPHEDGEPHAHNHENYDDAEMQTRNAMHADCPECSEGGDEIVDTSDGEGSSDY